MLQSLLIGVGGIILMMVGWVVVQRFWGETFAEYVSEEDVMAGRTKCANCHCTTACKNRKREAPGSDDVTIQQIETV